MEDRSTLGGTSKIALYFDRGVERLSQWRVVDPQGYLTTVQLANLERGRRMDPAVRDRVPAHGREPGSGAPRPRQARRIPRREV